VRSYQEIVYRDLYDGIDLSYRMQDRQLKYEFIVRPGADPALITMSYEGVEGVRLDGSGELIVSTALGEMRDGKPIAYQDEKVVDCNFVWRGPLSFGYVCEGRDPSQSLVIDPMVYAGFLGGSDNDWGEGIAVDSSGSAYVTGHTSSMDFPATPGSFDTTFNGGLYGDAFVAKLDATGSALVYATFLGGGSHDFGGGIATDSSGSAYVTGHTFSVDFPATSGSFDATFNGVRDAFVARLSPTGSALVYATFLGGGSDDYSLGIAVSSSGNAYVTGRTWSPDFPVTSGSFDTTFNGLSDAFAVKLNTVGSALVYATLLGGGDDDWGWRMAIDSSGSAYVTGYTNSPDFPVTPGSFDTTFNGLSDAFAVKLDAPGSALIYATFLGGGGNEEGRDIAVDASGNAYVTGVTWSTDFPVTPGSFDTAYNGSGDAFVAKMDATGSAIVYATFLGGSGEDWGDGIAIDSSGSTYVTGHTWSTGFPTMPGSFDTTYNGDCDAFVARLNVAGSALVYASFLGGGGEDWGYGIAVDSSGSAYVTGWTFSTDFPATLGSFDTTHNGDWDAFVVKLDTGGSANTPPIAEAGPDKSAHVRENIVFNGSLSYDPDLSASWSIMAPMSTERRGAGVAAVGNMVYAVGGAQPDFPYGWIPLSTNEVYDVANNTWSAAKPMPTARDLASAAVVGGRIYVIGGIQYMSPVPSNEEYDPVSNTWTTKKPMPPAASPYYFFGFGVAHGKIYAVNPFATFEYDPASDTWQTLSPPPNAPGSMAVASLNDKVYAFGGVEVGGRVSSLAYVYDPLADNWSLLPRMTVPRVEGAAIGLAGRLFYIGGEVQGGGTNNNVTGTTEMYDPATGLWTTKAAMPTPRDEMAIAAVDDAFYVVGGAGVNWDPIHDKNERYSFTLTYDWDFGDGSAHSSEETAAHSFGAPGVYTVTLQVTDAEGAVGTDTLIVTITESDDPPEADAGGPYIGHEGFSVSLDGSSSSDLDGDTLRFRWDFDNDGVWDTQWSTSPAASHIWGDDWNGKIALQVSDGNLTDTATADVTILNLPPSIDANVTVLAAGSLTLRVAGEKWHDVTATVYENGVEKFVASVVRTPGSPDNQSAVIGNLKMDLSVSDVWSARVVYSPPDDPVNGQEWGANPAWLVFNSELGNESALHHTFNVRHNDTWVWNIPDLRALMVGIPLDFTATATDPGSDDLIFTWDWGDGTTPTATTYFNDGIGPDAHPSPGGTFPYSATDTQAHAYAMAGTYTITLTVTDDDGGSATTSMTITIG